MIAGYSSSEKRFNHLFKSVPKPKPCWFQQAQKDQTGKWVVMALNQNIAEKTIGCLRKQLTPQGVIVNIVSRKGPVEDSTTSDKNCLLQERLFGNKAIRNE